MAYFVFNPQTNSLDDSDHPTPIRKNLGEKLLAKKDDNIYPWGYDKNPPWAYIPKDPFDPGIHERFLEDFDIRNETMHADGGLVRQPFAPKNIKRIADPPHSISDVNLGKKLGYTKDSWLTMKNKQMGPYHRTVDALGEPIKVTGRKAGHPEIFWDKTNLNKDVIKKITTAETKWSPAYAEANKPGNKVLNNPQLKAAFIKAYKQGHGGKHVMKVIDPKNTLQVSQVPYGSKVLGELIKSGELDVRTIPSIEQQQYFEKQRGAVDADIKLLAKNKNPNITAEDAARKIYPEFDKTPDGSPKKTAMVKDARYRLYDYYEWLNKRRPDSEILKNVKLPDNAKEIKAALKKRKSSIWPNQLDDALQRRYQFYELDKTFKKDFGYHEGLKSKLQAQLNYNKIPYVVEHGPSLSRSLTAKLPWYGKMINLMKPNVNQQKIKLDMNILKAYEAATDANTSVASKKKNKAILDYNNMADKFAKKWNVKVPKFVFGDPINSYPAIKNADAFDKQTSKGIYKTYNDFGWHLENAGTPQENLTKVVKDKISKGEPMGKKRQFIMAFTGIRNKLQDIVNKIPGPKVLKAGPGAAAAAIDYGLFHYILGVPAAPAGLGAASWMIKFPEGAGEKLAKINTALMAVEAGEKSPDEFLTENSDFLKEIVKEQFTFSEPYGEDDEVGTERLTEMEEVMEVPQRYAGGGPVIPRVEYRDGSMLGDARGWEKMLDMSDPDVVAKLEAKKVMDEQKYAENRAKAHENRFLHRTDDYYTSQEESFIPHYVQDVAKTTFGTEAGRKYFGSKLAEGAVEGTEWLVMQIPHLMSKVNPVGLMKLQKEMEEGNFSWMDLLYEPKLGEKWGMNKYQQQKLEELRDQAIAEGKPGIPQGVETLGTTGELGAMFADPFVAYGAYRKLAPHLKTKKRGIEEQVDEGRRDFTKLVGGGGLMVALAKIFPGIFKDAKALKTAGAAKKVGQTVKQFGNVRGMPDWFPSFMLKATQKGKLKSLPDRDYIEPMVYELMLPVKIRLAKGKIHTKEVPVTVTQNPRNGTMSVTWTGTDNYGDDIKRTIDYTPGETGTQNYAADEYGRGVSKEEVVIQDPEFNYTEPDYTSMGPEDTSPDSASFLDIHDEADAVVEAMEEFVKGTDDTFKKKAADDFKLYNQTDEHFGDATGHQNADGDWVSGEDNLSFPSYDKEVKDVYKPGWNRKKKAMGGVASGPPPLSGPVPQGLPSLQPGDIYNEWIK
jgi:hypothetical protein